MALVIEDGSGVGGANSYVSAADYTAWATARGYTVTATEAQIEAAAILAMDYLQIAVCYQGDKVEDDQALEYPRSDVYIRGALFADDAIPSQLKQAELFLIHASLSGVDLMPNSSGVASDYVIKEKVGPIETTYADPTNIQNQPTFTAVNKLLAVLLGDQCNAFGSFDVVRG